jgi:hypothetical protein
MFEVGQKVRSEVTNDCLIEGKEYTIIEVDENEDLKLDRCEYTSGRCNVYHPIDSFVLIDNPQHWITLEEAEKAVQMPDPDEVRKFFK